MPKVLRSRSDEVPKKEKFSSGDWLVDWHFWRFVHIVKYDGWKIRIKRLLKDAADPPEKREVLHGLVILEKKMIYLNPALRRHPTKDTLGETLLHELAHILYDRAEDIRIMRHRNIYQLEKLWHRFSGRQKDMLLSFIPKKYVPKK